MLENFFGPQMPPGQCLAYAVLSALGLLLVMAGLFGLVLALFYKIRTLGQRRVFWKNLARQTAQMSLAALLCAVLPGLAILWLKGQLPYPSAVPASLSCFCLPSVLLPGLALGLAAAACGAALWMLGMRKHQNYGRDYYSFALPRTARTALACTLLCAASLLTSSWAQSLPFPAPLICPALLVISGLGWLPMSRSTHPLRHSLSVGLATILLWAALAWLIATNWPCLP